jgi:hypothetical protein
MQRRPNPALFLAITCSMSIAPAIVETLARVGFAVKGAVYLILGLLALLAGLGERGGRITDTHGAIATLLGQPFGRLVVGVLALGLALYSGWRFLEAFADANRVGSRASAIATRTGWAVSGLGYGLLALDAGRLALRWRAGGGTNPPNTIIASPLAPWLVTLVGIGIIVYAATEIRRALAPRFSERLNIGRVAREAGQLIVGISRAGIAARAVVMAALGVVLLRARSAAAAAGSDMADSLRLVAALPSGAWGLTLVAAGLMAYGVYMVVHARYRHITAP